MSDHRILHSLLSTPCKILNYQFRRIPFEFYRILHEESQTLSIETAFRVTFPAFSRKPSIIDRKMTTKPVNWNSSIDCDICFEFFVSSISAVLCPSCRRIEIGRHVTIHRFAIDDTRVLARKKITIAWFPSKKRNFHFCALYDKCNIAGKDKKPRSRCTTESNRFCSESCYRSLIRSLWTFWRRSLPLFIGRVLHSSFLPICPFIALWLLEQCER